MCDSPTMNTGITQKTYWLTIFPEKFEVKHEMISGVQLASKILSFRKMKLINLSVLFIKLLIQIIIFLNK